MRSFRRGNVKVIIIVLLVILMVMGLMCAGVLAAILLPAVQQARMAAQRTMSSNNLKQIALALHNYHDVHGTFPPAYIPDENGRPMHSWRVLILPYLEAQHIYDQYDFSQPWDSPANLQIAEQMPGTYISPAMGGTDMGNLTTYVAVAGPKTVLNTEKGIALQEITAGTSNTIMVVEDTSNPVMWSQPTDISPQALLSKNFDTQYFHGTQAALADGSVHFYPEGSKAGMQGMMSIDGGN